MSDKITVLAERDNEVLIRIDGKEILGNSIYRTVRHEWWTDKEKMKTGVQADENGMYMRGFAGSKDEDLVKLFNGKN